MDEATRAAIAREVDIWMKFGSVLVLIFQWFVFVRMPASEIKYPRVIKFCLWAGGIGASAMVVTYGLMDTIFDSPNPLHLWMRVVAVLAYLAVWGYILKRRSVISPPKMPTTK
ncbi:MAG: hypothetical protein NZO41_03525 [Candidatus Bipolaricaulota bacterium]|nr:hypothetical protein [Candidatus Bipolaricaulota bacterium]MDW8141217.1 hypothetical protein [Candidatus Bipolaricaulota bacterium]